MAITEFTPRTTSENPLPSVPCKQFTVHFKAHQRNESFVLVFHTEILGHALTVSEPITGLRIGVVPYTTRAACLNNDKSAATMFVENLIERKGGDLFYDKLTAAIQAAKKNAAIAACAQAAGV